MIAEEIFLRLAVVEATAGDEARVAVGQGINRLLRAGCGEMITDPKEVRRRALALAWCADPQAFGGRSLKAVLEAGN